MNTGAGPVRQATVPELVTGGATIRRNFLAYFAANGHAVVPSSNLVPAGDDTLLFTNAGMVQFKDVFLGLEERSYRRAATVQKCVRAGGKHNDLDMVGRTPRHHTFFEMLGNFSFGDYFKAEAIALAWKFLTAELDLAPERLYITIFREDHEAEGLWRKVAGVGRERILRLGEKDNFWSMGDTGPCGPCSEILVDRGADKACGPDCLPGKCDCDRWLEIWNLVFMQYSRRIDGSLQPLPRPSIDTGMGLERIASVLQEVDSNFATDLFTPLLTHLERVCGVAYDPGAKGFPFRVIADHARTIAFLLAEGQRFSNEGRGYVLRRILRRAALYGKKLNIESPFLPGTIEVVAQTFVDAYPELLIGLSAVKEAAKIEEERFGETLALGSRWLADFMGKSTGTAISGSDAFLLYDTYGFPLELTEEMAGENNFTVDREGFARRLDEQRRRARADREKSVYATGGSAQPTGFVGYSRLAAKSKVESILVDGNEGQEATGGSQVGVVVEVTPFYAEGGGQVGDKGRIVTGLGTLEVADTTKLPDGRYLHQGVVTGGLIRVGDEAHLVVEPEERRRAARNHTATHLLQAALRRVLGDGVKQTGSLVEREFLRFDFTHMAPVTKEELEKVEDLVNDRILEDKPVATTVMSLEEARGKGALAFFGEKYGEKVRMVEIGDFSRELCGGTHVERTGEIGLFHLVSEAGIGAGVRRVTAVTGRGILVSLREKEGTLREVAELLRVGDEKQLTIRMEEALSSLKALERERSRWQRAVLEEEVGKLERTRVGGSTLVVGALNGAEPDSLRSVAEGVRDGLGSGAAVLGTVVGGKPYFVAAVSPDLVQRGVSAGAILRECARAAGGGGGGRPDFAQAGGKDPAKLPEALQLARKILQDKLAGA